MVVFNYLVPAMVLTVCTTSPSHATANTIQLMHSHRHGQATVQNVVSSSIPDAALQAYHLISFNSYPSGPAASPPAAASFSVTLQMAH